MTFFGEISEQLARFFKPYNLTIAFRTINTLKKHLVKNKDKTDILDKSGVYSLRCAECSAVYIGQTGRKLSVRINEHLSLVNKYKNTDITNTNSAFANHLLSSNHNFSIQDNVKVLHQCDKGKKLDLLEKLEIFKSKKSPSQNCVNEVFNFEPHLIFNNII